MNEDTPLVFPYNEIFKTYDEANAAFELTRLAMHFLGVESENDQRFSLTMRKHKRGHLLRLNYGTWAILSFCGPGTPEDYEVDLLMKEGIPDMKMILAGFKRKPDEPSMAWYYLPMDEMGRFMNSYAAEMEEGLRFVNHHFGGRKESLFRHANQMPTARAVFHPEERRALLTGESSMHLPFTEKTFELLKGISQEPTLSYYQAHQAEFQHHVEGPFQRILTQVATSLPGEIKAVMETKRRIFARFAKNDYGKGGAWPFYWGAFYPKGSKRSQDAQLSMWLNYELCEHGFYIGNYGAEQQLRFTRNCATFQQPLEQLMAELTPNDCPVFGERANFVVSADRVSYRDGNKVTWRDFLQDPARFQFDISFIMPKSILLQQDETALIAKIIDNYKRLFPMVILASSDDPMPEIESYVARHFPDLTVIEVVDMNQPYTLADVAAATGLDIMLLSSWVGAVQRKRQAIIYGPPGTGKTFLAKHLAKHLIGEGNGFQDVVQFHPAYAYEDFVQGIRPQARPDGGLDYPVVPGRFLEFCREATACKGPCILIIDEINRANLARVFGELMYLLEYRDQKIPLAAGGSRFQIPENVLIIGTMNTADRSIALVDHAMRRRFAFLELRPQYQVLRTFLAKQNPGFPAEQLVALLEDVNRQIDDRHYEVGISFFLNSNLTAHIKEIWTMEIEPYLDEYFFDQRAVAESFAWSNVKAKLQP